MQASVDKMIVEDGGEDAGGLLADRVLAFIRQRIAVGDLRLGDRLNVAHTLSVSRGPVREAILQMSCSGLLVPAPNAGWRVIFTTVARERLMWIIGQINAIALSVVHLALAAYVTGHVLLTKRNVGSSIAWIGLAWLSPLVGSILYVLFGVNRVRARAISLKGKRPKRGDVQPSSSTTVPDDHLSPLELSVGRITGRRAEEGNAIVPLLNGDEAYPRMIAAIDAARTSIGLSTYIFRL